MYPCLTWFKFLCPFLWFFGNWLENLFPLVEIDSFFSYPKMEKWKNGSLKRSPAEDPLHSHRTPGLLVYCCKIGRQLSVISIALYRVSQKRAPLWQWVVGLANKWRQHFVKVLHFFGTPCMLETYLKQITYYKVNINCLRLRSEVTAVHFGRLWLNLR